MYYPYYSPALNPMPDQLAQLRGAQVPQQQAGSGLIWVQGEAGAKSYMVAPNTTVLLMDSEKNEFYIKSADASGMPLPLRVFDYTERTQKTAEIEPKDQKGNYVTREEFADLSAKFESFAAKMEVKTE